MEAYLDNSATTKCSEKVVELMTKLLLQDYGNPSALHTKGSDAEKYIRQARERIAKTMKVSEKEIIFTSGGTESNNLALIGTALANKRNGKHMITTAIEHASINAPLELLKEYGYEITYLPVDENGVISLRELENAIRNDTVLVSIMYVNNEIGAVEPIEEAGALIKEKNENTLFHVDAIQAYGKFRINPKKSKIDLLSVSGHKIHGPKGSGFLYVKEKTKIKPIIYGGGQQKNMRSGTENVPAYAGLGMAAEEAYTEFEQKQDKLYMIKQQFMDEVRKLEAIVVNGKTGKESAPHIVSVSVEGVRAEVLLHALEERGVFVSAGSACSSNKPAISATLKGIGVDSKLLDSTIRFSFSTYTTSEEISYAVEQMKELIPMLRKYTRH